MVQRLELPNEQSAKALTKCLGLCMCRMVGIRERKVSREVPTASEVRVRDELVEPIEQPKKSRSRFRCAGQRRFVPRKVLVGGAAKNRRNQPVFSPEVLIERSAGDIRLFDQSVHPDRGAA